MGRHLVAFPNKDLHLLTGCKFDTQEKLFLLTGRIKKKGSVGCVFDVNAVA